MTTWLAKHSTLVVIPLLVGLFILAWFFPSAGMLLGGAFWLLSFLFVSVAIARKQQGAYRLGRIGRGKFVRNTVLEITGAGLTMIAAGLLGRALAEMATAQMGDTLLRFAAGIAIGLFTGLAVGFVVSQTWGRMMRSLSP
jgi:hypothetical protein